MLRSILIFLVFSYFTWPCLAQDQSRQEVRQEDNALYSWDFGRVKEGQIVRHDFTLRNNSNKILKVKDVTTSCGCTVSVVKKDTLFPGESTTIEVAFNSEGYSGPTQQYIYVHTDDLDNPVLRFIIKADVVKKP